MRSPIYGTAGSTRDALVVPTGRTGQLRIDAEADAIAAFKAAITADLGYAPDVIEPGRLHRFPTSDHRGDDAGWCRLFDDYLGGVYGDHRRAETLTWQATSRRASTPMEARVRARQIAQMRADRRTKERAKWAGHAEHIERVWNQSLPIRPGDAVSLYLASRGLVDLRPLPDCLRLSIRQPYFHGATQLGVFPAMIAPVTAPDGRIVALHRTFLTSDGQKAPVPSPKKLTRTAGPLAGSCIRLGSPTHGVIGIAEGIETALAARSASGIPTVAAYCASNLAAWCWPSDTRRIVIFGDADEAGREASETLRQRARASGIHVETLIPTEEGVDWADVWASRTSANETAERVA